MDHVETTPIPLEVLDDNRPIPLCVSMEIREIKGDFPIYEGPYEVDPAFEDRILETKNTTLTDDVTVNAIIVSRTTNPSGGNTVYIGGIINA